MITAKQAREITYLNNELSELEWIERQIIDACNSGRDVVVISGELYDNTIKELRNLGYAVSMFEFWSHTVIHIIKW